MNYKSEKELNELSNIKLLKEYSLATENYWKTSDRFNDKPVKELELASNYQGLIEGLLQSRGIDEDTISTARDNW